MSATSRSKWVVNFLLDFVFILIVISAFHLIIDEFFIPSPLQYNDPRTEIDESFPWNPHLFNEPNRVLELLVMGSLRHIAFLPNSLSALILVGIIGRLFFVWFIFNLRRTIKEQNEIRIHDYVNWGIGSIIGAIIHLTGTTHYRKIPDVAIATIGFSIAALILYSFHPRLGLFFAIKERISFIQNNNPKSENEKN